jgi:hypothetical protein
MNVMGRMVPSHRVSYELFKGPIEDGKLVLHSCDNPSCVNPDHLFLGTHEQNMADRNVKGRAGSSPGSQNGQSKLTALVVEDIRATYERGGVTQASLALKYGVAQSQISHIISNKRWRTA